MRIMRYTYQMVNDMYPFEVKGFRSPGPVPLDFSDKRLIVVRSSDWLNSYHILTRKHQSWKLTRKSSQEKRMRLFLESEPIKNLSVKFQEATGSEMSEYALEQLMRTSRIRCNGYDVDAIKDNKLNIHIFLGAYPWITEAKTWLDANEVN